MGKPVSSYRIARSRKTSVWLVWLLWSAVAVAGGYGLYRLGGDHRVRDHALLQAKIIAAYDELSRLRAAAAQSQSELAKSSQRQQMDELAKENLALELNRLRHQLIELRKELKLYSSLAEQNIAAAGVEVYQFEINVDASVGGYRYELVLAQPLASKGKATGAIQIRLIDAARSRLIGEHDFEFQVFQRISGTVDRDPDVDDVGRRVVVTIAAGGDDIVREFLWRDLIGVKQGDEKSE